MQPPIWKHPSRGISLLEFPSPPQLFRLQFRFQGWNRTDRCGSLFPSQHCTLKGPLISSIIMIYMQHLQHHLLLHQRYYPCSPLLPLRQSLTLVSLRIVAWRNGDTPWASELLEMALWTCYRSTQIASRKVMGRRITWPCSVFPCSK